MTPQKAVLALVAAGWSESRISREVGTSQPTIHRIKRGAMPRGPSFAVSQAVIGLAESVGKGVDSNSCCPLGSEAAVAEAPKSVSVSEAT